jgi:hypothetical protein
MNAPFTPSSTAAPTRRDLVVASTLVGGALLVGCSPADIMSAGSKVEVGAFGPFIKIAPDGVVTVISKHLEMGQGNHAGLSAIVAEELDADWTKVMVEQAPPVMEEQPVIVLELERPQRRAASQSPSVASRAALISPRSRREAPASSGCWQSGATSASCSVPSGSTAALICDTGALIDYLVESAPDHELFRKAIDQARTRYVPGLVLAEVDYFLRD